MQPEHREMPRPGFLQTIPLSRFTLAQGFTGSEQGTARTRAPLDQVLLVSSSWAAAATKLREPHLQTLLHELTVVFNWREDTGNFGAQPIGNLPVSP